MPVLNYFLIKIETPYEIPNLENKKKMWELAKNHFFSTLPPESL